MKKSLEQKKNGTPAERAAYKLVYYFSLMANDELRPHGLSKECEGQIVSIVEDIIEAAVEKAVEKFVSVERAMDSIGNFLK